MDIIVCYGFQVHIGKTGEAHEQEHVCLLYTSQGYPQVTTIYDNTPEEYLFLSMFNTVGKCDAAAGILCASTYSIPCLLYTSRCV